MILQLSGLFRATEIEARMLYYPTRQQREKLFENLIIQHPGSISQNTDNEKREKTFILEDSLEKPYYLSPFTFLLHKKHYCAFYHSVNLKTIFGDQRLVSLHRAGVSGQPRRLGDFMDALAGSEHADTVRALALLIETGFLVEAGSDPHLLLRKLQDTWFFKDAAYSTDVSAAIKRMQPQVQILYAPRRCPVYGS